MSNTHGPSLTAARFYRKISQKGSTYFVARIGMLKAALLKSNETADNGDEIWNLVYQQAEERPRQDSKPSPEDRAKANDPLPAERASSRPMPDDPLPF